jgi:phosphoribosylanthranilate isomerase
MTKIKICGITRAEDAQLCAELGVDYIGFVFVRESKRFVEAAWVREIGRPAGAPEALIRPSATFSPAGEKGYLPSALRECEPAASPDDFQPSREAWQRVGVFRDAPIEELLRITEIARLDLIQLHGSEDEEYVRAIELPVIKVVDVIEPKSNAPYVMFDSGGGTGRTFDWSLVEHHRPRQPFFLAGGLTPENVGEAIRVTRPYAVDVSSGVESAPGIKNPQKLRDFVKKVRRP